MKTIASVICFLAVGVMNAFAQDSENDSLKTIRLEQVTISSNRVPVNYQSNPGSVSLVRGMQLSGMPKGIGAEEALHLVPGVRIDNQHDGKRVHISIRGQGILTERGLRGIGVLLDGIPLNDPSGFAPDLYDVDWSTVKKIEVLRGPAGGFIIWGWRGGRDGQHHYGGWRSPTGWRFTLGQTLGSNGFSKSHIQISGSNEPVDYRISYSHVKGDGYRDHQAFWANNLYEKVNFHPLSKFHLTQIVAHTGYFQQNPEGVSLAQLSNPRQANPDALPFNEYQKTSRTTFGVHGTYQFSSLQDLEIMTFLRSWRYKETSNKAAEYSEM